MRTNVVLNDELVAEAFQLTLKVAMIGQSREHVVLSLVAAGLREV